MSWERLAFSVQVGGRQLRVELTHAQETYFVDEGEALEVTIRGTRHTLQPGVPFVAPGRLAGVGPVDLP